MQSRVVTLTVACLAAFSCLGQDVYLSPLKKIKASEKEISQISFSSDSKWIAISDSKGEVSLRTLQADEILGKVISPDVVLHDFIDENKKFFVLDQSGRYAVFNTATKEIQNAQFTKGIKSACLDPNSHYLTFLTKENNIEIQDLKANMTLGRITKLGGLSNAMFMGYDRFGQQLAAINKIGESLTFNPYNQQLLRQLKLQSGEYEGSKSVIHSVSTNSGGDKFIVGLQEVFIPKGGMQGRSQPERRNMLITYDWATGQETKRVPLRFRPDGMAMGPGPANVAFFSTDSRTINMLNMDNAVVTSSVSVDERPNAIALSDDNDYLAVGTVAGNVYIYEVIRNNPAEIKISKPAVNRNYGEQIITEPVLNLEGQIESKDRVAKVFVNGEPATLDMSQGFSSKVPLEKGKNRIKISVHNTQNVVTEKDIYVTCEPQAVKEHKASQNFNKRLALVIGNANYAQAGKLNNTLNDANAMAKVLQELGFEVIKVTDGNYEQMKTAIYTFGDRIQDVNVSIFYYAGHGLEVDGTNYLVPVDANIQSALDVKLKTIPLTGIIRTMEFTNDEGLNMLILDACRNNPFPTGKRSSGSGLASIQPPSGTLIAYATDPGSVASDGDAQNGLYTGELVKQLRQSQRIEDIFMNTRNSVEKISGGKQRPWEEARLKGVFYLK
ncbi:MAG TPA: caspase family protein [Chryseosolibacter sp.]